MKLRTIQKRCMMFWVNHVLAGPRAFALKRRLLLWAGHEIGENTKVVGPVFCTGKLRIGSDCWIGRNLTVHGVGTVEIADHCDLAPDVTFLTGGHRLGTSNRRAGEGESYSIHVGPGTWIGGRATIGKNVEIGTGCVIAACACVMRDVPENTLVGGVPAKVIRELEP